MDWLFIALISLIFGSFLNVCIWRMPRGQNIAWPGSHCVQCGYSLRWYDNIPVLSFLFLKGKCRQCRVPVSFRYPLVEIAAGALGVLAYAKWGGTPYTIMAMIILWSLIVITGIDLSHQIIPDFFTLGGIIVGFVFSGFYPDWIQKSGSWNPFVLSGLGILVGGGFLLAIACAAEFFLKKEAMGGGDIKYMAAVGAFFGWHACLFVLFFSSVIGSVSALILKGKNGGDQIPFGPYLAAATVFYMFLGESCIQWYLSSVLQY